MPVPRSGLVPVLGPASDGRVGIPGCPSCRSCRRPDPQELNKRLGRGVNIIGYDPLWKSRDKARFQEKHFRLIAEAGFSHVRVNLHPVARPQDRRPGPPGRRLAASNVWKSALPYFRHL